MSKHVLAILLLLVAFGANAQDSEDPFLWLEDVEGEKAMAWVKGQNKTSVEALAAHPRFDPIYQSSLDILNSDDRIPYVAIRGDYVYNFWQDADNEKGVWRRTTLSDYATDAPSWEVILDVDQLAAAEGENWVWKGSSCLYPDYLTCMVNLSRGGADAVVRREFDVSTKAFVENGFHVPEAKGGTSWLDRNTLYVATDFGEGSLTTSGYPRVAKIWKRGTSLTEAEVVYEGEETDVGVWAYASHTPESTYEIVTRAITFYRTETLVRLGGRMVRLDIPLDANMYGFFKGQMLVELKSDWEVGGKTYPQGALLGIDLDDFLAGSRQFDEIVVPGERSSLAGVSTTENLLLINMLDNVKSVLYEYRFGPDDWVRTRVDAPEFGSLSFGSTDEFSDTYFFNYNGFLTPSSLYLVDHESGERNVRQVKSLPAFFDASGLVAEQFEAESADGTRIPYFLVRGKDQAFDGTNPTLLYGYGGFEISMRPGYSATRGTAWLAHGGVFVMANIRGGGEFGPKWHQAALKENRQRAYDDFIAVAEDLIERRVTSPDRLGIMGGSNGGLLVGAVFTQRPELFNAVVCQVPLLDMKRYNKLLAGASWMAEYGNPDIPEEWAYIRKYSPYQNVSADMDYPEVFFVTSTRDDRVHPGHARKMAAKMLDMGHPVYYYENTEGGHAAATNNKQRAYMAALSYAYLWNQLAPTPGGKLETPSGG